MFLVHGAYISARYAAYSTSELGVCPRVARYRDAETHPCVSGDLEAFVNSLRFGKDYCIGPWKRGKNTDTEKLT
jgi:hypothetical protein